MSSALHKPDGRTAPARAGKKQHISEQNITWTNWHKHANWLNIIFIVGIPMAGLASTPWVPLRLPTAIWAVVYYFFTGLGITAGYHRLWSHTSYSARLPLQIFLAALGGGAVQGSIQWWSRGHRAHHRYTDTDKDPYSVNKGILYAHFGWMLLKQDPKRAGRSDITDLNDDPVVMWQHRNYMKVVLTMALIFPMLVAGLWGDFTGGLIYAGILRFFFVQQATFCINSIAHWLGDQPFDDRNSPRDHVLTALITLGEGYHNFHHEFPSDYRNAIEWHQYDPTKWSIWLWKQLGLAYDLKQFRSNEYKTDIFLVHQVECAQNIYDLLADSQLARLDNAEVGLAEDRYSLRQDRYPLRTAPQFLGPQIEDILSALEAVTKECNSSE